MKYLFLFTLVLGMWSVSYAQDWQTNFTEAQEQAKTESKKLILVFQGSDWCAPCIKLDHEIWSSEAFVAYAKDHFVMVKADFPRKKKNALSEEQQKHNDALAEKYNSNGYFPYVVVFDHEGNILGSTSYEKLSPEEYIAHLESL